MKTLKNHMLRLLIVGITFWASSGEIHAAAINDGQMLEVGSDAYNAVALVRIPMSHGLWTTTKPVDVKLDEGIQKVRVAVLPDERGIAVRWFELRPKGLKE